MTAGKGGSYRKDLTTVAMTRWYKISKAQKSIKK